MSIVLSSAPRPPVYARAELARAKKNPLDAMLRARPLSNGQIMSNSRYASRAPPLPPSNTRQNSTTPPAPSPTIPLVCRGKKPLTRLTVLHCTPEFRSVRLRCTVVCYPRGVHDSTSVAVVRWQARWVRYLHTTVQYSTVVGVGLPPPDLRNTFGLIALCIAFRPGLRALHSALRFTWWLAVGVVPYGIHVQYHSLRLDSL